MTSAPFIRDLFAAARIANRHVFSFEFFPTKTEEGERALLERTIPALARLSPDFCSVTYGAGGSTRAKTLTIVDRIQREQRLPTMAHLTCVNATVEQTREVLAEAARLGIRNILALRGDPVDGAEFSKAEGGFEVLLRARQVHSRGGRLLHRRRGISRGTCGLSGRQIRRLAAPETQDRSGRRLRHYAAVLRQSRLLRASGLPGRTGRRRADSAGHHPDPQHRPDQAVRRPVRRRSAETAPRRTGATGRG